MSSSRAHALAQPRNLPLNVNETTCKDRTYIVTGANVGLGLETTRHLVAAGASKVIMAVRSPTAGASALADIEASTSTSGVAEVWHLDLSSFASVREFAARVIEELGQIDAVIENAAVAIEGTRAEGYPTTLTVNVLSTMLLAVLLLPKLRSDAVKYGYVPRVSIVTSGTAFDIREAWERVRGDAIGENSKDEGMAMYPMSKLLEILSVREIARLLPVARGKVVINLINPGLCVTSLCRNGSPELKEGIRQLWEKCGRSAECGSRTLLAGAVAGEDSHGVYMNDCGLAE
ncbi:NAD(P)-binding protein [Pseudovirgaria hyperparasitica]|uniref:NAD(P)-binding protein n=1 Tax=Pseudovirgaria hyperparasitica TaxID=470096 RepID=A0A6A6WG01_9PEZI|nr:NAD(P)-binding protein [Pseudovirgaria hyperparasitica]KAF2760061.1 NAD(P)-binding protein [Pseudovirgaria hyperparasitica]